MVQKFSAFIRHNPMRQFNLGILNSQILFVFRNDLLKFIRPTPNSGYSFRKTMAIKSVTLLQLGLIHLENHNVDHNLQDSLNLKKFFIFTNVELVPVRLLLLKASDAFSVV